MSLIAWYPLNGDTEDYSGNGNSLILRSSGGKIVESLEGKIGECLERKTLNDSSEYLEGKNEIFLSGDFTFACWAFVSVCHAGTANGLVSNHSHSHNTGAGITVKHVSDTDFRVSCNTGNGTSRTYHSYYGTTNIKDKWSHLVMRYDSKTKLVSLWVNGVKEKEVGYTMVTRLDKLTLFNWSTTYTAAAYRPASKLNDVRVYDHALSPKEIKEIVKAKVLHYKFDDPYEEPTTNLIPNNPTPYLVQEDSSYRRTATTKIKEGHYRFEMERKPDFINGNWWPNVQFPSYPFTAEKEYTISLDIRVISSAGSGSGIIRHSAVQNDYWVAGTPRKRMTGGEWNRVTLTRTLQSSYYRAHDNSDISSSPRIEIYTDLHNAGDALTFEVKNYQVEEKDHATPFTTGTRQSIIRDCSGFRNDGVISLGSPSWQQDRSIGSSSVFFDSLIRIEPPRLLGNTQEITLSAWFKSKGSAGGAHHQIFGGPEAEVSVQDGGAVRFGFHVNGVRRVSNHGSGVTDGKWHHIVSVYGNGKRELFVDGTKIASNNEVGTLSNDFYRTVNTHGSSAAYWTNGNLDDIRIYATALSSSDIKELYELRGSIEPNGTFWVEDINEEDTGASLSSTGTAHYSTVNEVGSPIRYIRDFLNGSTSNTGNHWVEIKAIDLDGNNVALGKGIGTLTDGNTASTPYYSKGSGLQSVTIDLGSIHNVEYLQVWHYYYDKRTYHKTKTQVSSDGVNWVTLFDSGVEGEYQETSLGRKYLLTNDKVSISQSGDLFVSEITEI